MFNEIKYNGSTVIMHRYPLLIGPEELDVFGNYMSLIIIDLDSDVNDIPPMKMPYHSYSSYNLELLSASGFSGVFKSTIKNNSNHLLICDSSNYLKSSVFVWNMHAFGYYKVSIWEGSSKECLAWASKYKVNEACENAIQKNTSRAPRLNTAVIADRDLIQQTITEKEGFATLLDSRCEKGIKPTNQRTILYCYKKFFTEENKYKLRPSNEIIDELSKLGLDRSFSEIICHCHSYKHSALCYVLLKYLGFNFVKCYPGESMIAELPAINQIVSFDNV